jgi:hypothetical protein
MEISKKSSSAPKAALSPPSPEVARTSMEEASSNAANRISGGLYSDAGGNVAISLDQEMRTGLGLLLKHRGGPGFGHGRLQGSELDILETRLRSISRKLVSESQ